MTGSTPTLDPITLEVIHNGLRSIADETFIALMKSAYSTNIKERHDHSTGIMDAGGRTIVQAELTQAVHLNSMNGNVATVLKEVAPEDIAEGDIFISNDPYAANGSHLPDVNFAMPVFVEGKLLAFVCNIAHHADIGGIAPGSMSSSMTEIYQEGVRLPMIRLFRRGELVEDVLKLILLNVRLPVERRGDYFAQVAACRLGARRLQEFAARYGYDLVKQAFGEIVDRTALRMRRAIAAIAPGDYAFEDVMDDDGQGRTDIPLRLKVQVKGDHIVFDFTGTASQGLGNINCPMNATQSMVGYVLKALLDPEIPNNHGVMETFEVIAEPGSLVNPVFPAAVAYRAHTCQRVVDVALGALAKALPGRVLAASNGANTTAIFSGTDPRSGKPYLYLETLGGGCGGRPAKDGKDGVQQHVANTANLPLEAIETEYPLLVESYSLAPDSGGAGRNRGGLALRRVIRPVGHTATFTGAGERFRHAPWGVFGGASGATGSFEMTGKDGTSERLSNKPPPTPVSPEQCLVVTSPGAGGYGDPAERRRDRLALDLASGKFSAAYLAANYGIDPGSLANALDDGDFDYEE
jgi:N-methylhydantoinase B